MFQKIRNFFITPDPNVALVGDTSSGIEEFVNSIEGYLRAFKLYEGKAALILKKTDPRLHDGDKKGISGYVFYLIIMIKHIIMILIENQIGHELSTDDTWDIQKIKKKYLGQVGEKRTELEKLLNRLEKLQESASGEADPGLMINSYSDLYDRLSEIRDKTEKFLDGQVSPKKYAEICQDQYKILVARTVLDTGDIDEKTTQVWLERIDVAVTEYQETYDNVSMFKDNLDEKMKHVSRSLSYWKHALVQGDRYKELSLLKDRLRNLRSWNNGIPIRNDVRDTVSCDLGPAPESQGRNIWLQMVEEETTKQMTDIRRDVNDPWLVGRLSRMIKKKERIYSAALGKAKYLECLEKGLKPLATLIKYRVFSFDYKIVIFYAQKDFQCFYIRRYKSQKGYSPYKIVSSVYDYKQFLEANFAKYAVEQDMDLKKLIKEIETTEQ